MDRVEFGVDTFPKLRIEAYHHGIPSIFLYLKLRGFKSIEYEFNEDRMFIYSASANEYTMLILRWG
jgi:hypothetical protein